MGPKKKKYRNLVIFHQILGHHKFAYATESVLQEKQIKIYQTGYL